MQWIQRKFFFVFLNNHATRQRYWNYATGSAHTLRRLPNDDSSPLSFPVIPKCQNIDFSVAEWASDLFVTPAGSHLSTRRKIERVAFVPFTRSIFSRIGTRTTNNEPRRVRASRVLLVAFDEPRCSSGTFSLSRSHPRRCGEGRGWPLARSAALGAHSVAHITPRALISAVVRQSDGQRQI